MMSKPPASELVSALPGKRHCLMFGSRPSPISNHLYEGLTWTNSKAKAAVQPPDSGNAEKSK